MPFLGFLLLAFVIFLIIGAALGWAAIMRVSKVESAVKELSSRIRKLENQISPRVAPVMESDRQRETTAPPRPAQPAPEPDLSDVESPMPRPAPAIPAATPAPAPRPARRQREPGFVVEMFAHAKRN